MEKTSTEQLAAIEDYLRQSNRWDSKAIGQIRQEMAATAANMPSPTDVIVERVMIGPLSGEWIIPVNSAPPADEVILYFHGGGFISGTCEFYRDLVTRIAKSSGTKILIIEYRLAPEFTYPAANEDCIDAYLWLLANGYSAGNVVLGGFCWSQPCADDVDYYTGCGWGIAGGCFFNLAAYRSRPFGW